MMRVNRTRFYGQFVMPFYYGTDEDFEAIKSGEVFKVEGNFDWYFRAIPFENRTSGVVSEKVACLHKTLVTSKYAKRWDFFTLEKSEGAKIYYGDSLKNKILKEIEVWMKNINPKTQKAFSGRDFGSYINTIPVELIVDAKFCDRIKKKMCSTLFARVKKSTSVEEVTGLTDLKKVADSLIDGAYKNAVQNFSGSVDVAMQTSKSLDDAKEKALAVFSEKSGKGGK